MSEPRTNWMLKGAPTRLKDLVGIVARLRGKTMVGLTEEIINEWYDRHRDQIQEEIAQCTTQK